MSAHNKHTANPDYKSGDNWVECDVCGIDIYASDSKKRWDGLIVCPDDWEIRHPQDFVRARKDKIAASIVNSESEIIYAEGVCITRTAIAGVAVAGCMIAGNDGSIASGIPTGTFNSNTL